MEVLIMAPEHKAGIQGINGKVGTKKVTIRNRHRPQFRVDDTIRIVSSDDSWGCSTILTSVEFYTYATIPEKDFVADGFISREDMISGMKKYYPQIEPTSEVTVLRWGRIFMSWAKR